MVRNKGQQEIVGFVLIVVLVVIGLMVFLIISMRDSSGTEESLEVENILNALMKHTTECAIVYEPNYDDFEDLFKSCYKGDRCSNLEKSACDYLDENLRAVVGDMMASEAAVNAYQIDFFVKGNTLSGHENLQAGEESPEIPGIFEGDCEGSMIAAQRSIFSGSDNLIIRMKICRMGNGN